MGKTTPPYLTDLVDLHLHLGSSSTPHFLWELAHEQGIRLEEKDYWEFIKSITVKEKTTYDKYLKLFEITELIQSSTYAIERAVHKAVSRAYRKGNVGLLEVRFNPMLRNKGGEQDLDKIIFSAVVGMKRACMEYPVRAGLIIMMDRRFTKDQNKIIAQKAVRFAKEGIIWVDIAGPITPSFSVSDIAESVGIAKDAGLGVTIHTGEVTGASEMWDVVKHIQPNRIGHGVRAVDDVKLMDHLREHHIVLEICPTSNLQTGAAKDWDDLAHMFNAFKEHNVPFTVNSDGPELLGTNVKEEFERLMEHGILTQKEVETCTETARDVTFIH